MLLKSPIPVCPIANLRSRREEETDGTSTTRTKRMSNSSYLSTNSTEWISFSKEINPHSVNYENENTCVYQMNSTTTISIILLIRYHSNVRRKKSIIYET